jgi:hypothetical protein
MGPTLKAGPPVLHLNLAGPPLTFSGPPAWAPGSAPNSERAPGDGARLESWAPAWAPSFASKSGRAPAHPVWSNIYIYIYIYIDPGVGGMIYDPLNLPCKSVALCAGFPLNGVSHA